MRIIAGEWRGRTIKAPRDNRVRPTGDRAREAWMSIVHPRLAGARVLDLYAGSGALGLEALSRGAVHCDFVEISEPALRAIRENATTLGALSRVGIHRADAARFAHRLAGDEYDLVFADPPYRLGLAPAIAALWIERPFAPFLGIEHDVHEVLPRPQERRVYGGTAITMYWRDDSGEGEATPAAVPSRRRPWA